MARPDHWNDAEEREFHAMLAAHTLMCHAEDMNMLPARQRFWAVMARRHKAWYQDREYDSTRHTYVKRQAH